MIYLMTFGISCLLFQLSESGYAKRKKSLKIILVFLAICVPSLLAGLRDSSIGTDVELYGNSWFRFTRLFNLKEYLDFAQRCSVGVIYALLNYVVALFTDDVKIFYFILSFLETAMIYFGIKHINNSERYIWNDKIKIKKRGSEISLPFAMFCYYTIFYNNTLNLLRQSLAITIVFLAYGFLVNRKYKTTIFLLILAVLSHSSAIFSFIILPLYLISGKFKSKFNVLMFDLVIFSVTAIAMIVYKPILNFLVSHRILSSRFFTYMEETVVGGRMIRTVFWFLLAFFAYIAFYKMINFRSDNKFIISCISMSAAFSLITFMGNVFAIRMAFYFDVSAIAFIPMIPKIYKFKIGKDRNMKYLVYILLIILLIGRWYLDYVRSLNGQTYPYKFAQF